MSHKLNDFVFFSCYPNVSWGVGIVDEIIQSDITKYTVKVESGSKYLINHDQIHDFSKFIEMWREDWSRLSFRKVTRVNLDKKKRFGMSYDFLDENNIWESSCTVDSIHDVPIEWKFSYQEYYHDYFGFTDGQTLNLSFSKFGYKTVYDKNNKNVDNYEDIYFNSKQYSCLDLDVSVTGTFSKSGHQTSSCIPPKSGDIICGIIKKRNDNEKPYFKNWFVSSIEFYKLWLLVMSDDNNINYEKIIDSLKTADWLEIYDIRNLTEMERIDILKKKPIRSEPHCINWTSIYQALACLYFNKIDHCNQYKLPNKFINKFVTKLSNRVLDRRLK